jgi:spore coat protein U-like protein
MNASNRILSAALFAALFAAGTAQAAVNSNSGQIIIRGTVGAICEVGVIDYGTNLDLVAGEQQRAVGEIKETCNDPDGYSVSFTSDKGGKMVGPLDATSAYRVNYDSITDHSLSTDASLPRPEPRWNERHELTVNVDGQDELPAGEYLDVVTVTIAAS